MHARTFDALTRNLTIGLPRRGALALMAGATSSLLLRGAAPVAAGCKKVGKTCDKNKDCCDNARCGGKKCKCKGRFTECGGKCFDLEKDEKHCGACNIQCAEGEGEICSSGRCVNVPS